MLAKHLERKLAEQKQQASAAKASSDGEVARQPEEAVFVREHLYSVVDGWMASSTALTRAPAHAVDIFANAVDGRAGLGGVAKASSAVRAVSEQRSASALDAALVKVKRRAALDEDDLREDQRFATRDAAADVADRGRSDVVVSRKRGANDAALPTVHSKLKSKAQKRREKKLGIV